MDQSIPLAKNQGTEQWVEKTRKRINQKIPLIHGFIAWGVAIFTVSIANSSLGMKAAPEISTMESFLWLVLISSFAVPAFAIVSFRNQVEHEVESISHHTIAYTVSMFPQWRPMKHRRSKAIHLGQTAFDDGATIRYIFERSVSGDYVISEQLAPVN